MKVRFCLPVLLFLTSLLPALNSQTPKTDSLENLLQRHSRKDTARIRLLNETAMAFYQVDDERMLQLAGQANDLAKKLNDLAGEAFSLHVQGIYHYSKSENQQARQFLEEALILFEGTEDQNGISACLNNLGRVWWKLGDYTKALEYIDKSYTIAEELEDQEQIQKCLSSYGIIHTQMGNYSQAAEYFQRSIDIGKKRGDQAGILGSVQNLGYIAMNQGNNAEALSQYEETLRILNETGNRKELPGCYVNIGIVHQNQGHYEEAIGYYQKASDIAKEFGQQETVSMCLNNIGLIHGNQGNYPLALEYIQNSLRIKEDLEDKRGISSCLMNIGFIHASQDNYPDAIEYLERSLELLEELQDNWGISNCLIQIGTLSGKQGYYPRALEVLEQALDMKQEMGDKLGISNCLIQIGHIYELQDLDRQALDYFRNSLALKEELNDQSGICDLYLAMGKVYLKQEDHSRALDFTTRSREIALELDLLYLLSNIYKQLSDIYRAAGEYRQAYANHVLYKEAFDSIFSEENVRRLAGLEYQYNYEKEKQAIELEQQKREAIRSEETKRQKIVRNSLLAGFVLMVLLAVLILRNFIQKRNANRILELQKNEITDSISYAHRIQHALFPPKESIDQMLQDYFILYRPRDIVSGDFYWISRKGDKVIVAVADCTGHGVPGAFMSLLGITFLNEIVNTSELLCADGILNQLREKVIHSLHQTGRADEARDGMEIALCIMDLNKMQLKYAGAYRPLYLVRGRQLVVIKGDRMPIGFHGEREAFSCHEQVLQQDDVIYLFSDGYVDQIGGPRKKSFRARQFRELLSGIQDLGMKEQQKHLERTIEAWRGEVEQIDDILVMGIRIA
jgi:tetratricopeptide (TPR) repeat protein